MIADSQECRQLIAELRRVVLRLSLVSHVSAMTLERATASSDEDIGGKRPSGGVDHTGDREFTYRQKSAAYFQRRLNRMVEAKALYEAKDLEALLDEAEDAVVAWAKTPDVSAVIEPERESFLWKCQIADDDRPVEVVMRVYSVHKSSVYRYRATYRGLRKSSVRRAS